MATALRRLIVAVCCVLLASSSLHAGERYALLVGVREYAEARELRPLNFSEADVTALSQVLKDSGYKQANVVLMTQTAGAANTRFLPIKARIRKELALLVSGRTEDDSILI